MPNCGTQCWLCDLPIHFDTYKGCSHGCEYCFVQRNGKYDLKDIRPNEGEKALRSFIEGKRNRTSNWCDWNIPLHWGGLSDPFQPCEKTMRLSYKALEVFAETQYPFVVSTKGKLVADEEYLSLLEKCNCVVQISLVCESYNKIERGCPTFEERLEIIRKLSSRVKRVVVRIQPYMHEVFDEVYKNLDKFKDAGAYGVIVEGMKYTRKRDGLIKIAGDYCYPYDVILGDFLKLREHAHELGLKIYAGENRIRKYGDSLTCCGIDGMEGFKANTFNLNHILNGDLTNPTEAMKKENTGNSFRALVQGSVKGNKADRQSFAFNMVEYYKEHKIACDLVMGVRK